MANRYRLLKDFSVEDISSGKQFNPLKASNVKQAESLAENGDYELLEIINSLETQGLKYKSKYDLNDEEELGLDALVDTIVTGGLGNRMASERYLKQALIDAEGAVNYNNYNKAAFINAGVPASQYNDEIGLIRENDKGKVPKYGRFLDTGFNELTPAPYVSPDGKKRVHTEYVKNPITGVPQIVPMMDVNDPSKAMSIDYGKYIPGKNNLASEVVQKHILKLMGTNPRSHAGVNGRNVGAADFQATIDGEMQNIDGMVRNVSGNLADTVNIPLYMNIRPEGKQYPNTIEGNKALRGNVYGQILGNMERKNNSLEEAVESLKNSRGGGLTGPPNIEQQIGKVLRSDKSLVKEGDNYDMLINTGYDRSDNVIGKPDDYTSAPSTVNLIDLQVARDISNQKRGKAGTKQVFVTTNKNGGVPASMRDQARSAKVQHIYNMSDSSQGRPLSIDVLADPKYAAVHQAIRDLKYK
jgi:hypothetical protein